MGRRSQDEHVFQADLVNSSKFSLKKFFCPLSAPYLGHQTSTGLFAGCNSFLGHSDAPLCRKPNKAWLLLFLTLTPGPRRGRWAGRGWLAASLGPRPPSDWPPGQRQEGCQLPWVWWCGRASDSLCASLPTFLITLFQNTFLDPSDERTHVFLSEASSLFGSILVKQVCTLGSDLLAVPGEGTPASPSGRMYPAEWRSGWGRGSRLLTRTCLRSGDHRPWCR